MINECGITRHHKAVAEDEKFLAGFLESDVTALWRIDSFKKLAALL